MKPWKRLPSDSRAVTARVRAHHALYNMGLRNSTNSYYSLKHILGYPVTMDDHVFCVSMTMKDVETLELIAGPHGYAIYKMLEARQRRQNEE